MMLPPLEHGIASHHAGCLPAWKSMIEDLYKRGALPPALKANKCTDIAVYKTPDFLRGTAPCFPTAGFAYR